MADENLRVSDSTHFLSDVSKRRLRNDTEANEEYIGHVIAEWTKPIEFFLTYEQQTHT